jgi:signal transduction histidine kinase
VTGEPRPGRDSGVRGRLGISHPGLEGVWIALPLALLLLLGLSSFTLLSYRNAIDLLVEERREEARRLARSVAAELPPHGVPGPALLRQLAPHADRVMVGTVGGQVLAAAGEPLHEGFLDPLGGEPPGEMVVGPGAAAPSSVVAYRPLGRQPEPRLLRVDLGAPVLASQRHTLRLITWVVVGSNVAVALWLLFFLHRLLGPYQRLLDRARELRSAGDEGTGDDRAFLLETFERALTDRDAGGGELQVLEETLGRSLESGLLLLDREGRVLALNAVGAGLLGVTSPAPLTPAEELLAPHPELRELLSESLDAQRAIQRREVTLKVGSEPQTLGVTATPLQRAGGELLGLLVLFADLTEVQREAQATRLAESLAHLGELAAGVAHELRNGLATLIGYVELMERAPDAGQAAELQAEVRRETEQLRRVVDDFLTFARPGTARLEPVDLTALARRALADPALEEVDLELAVGPDRVPILLAGDAHLLERALRNLLYNAVEAEQRGGGAVRGVRLAGRWEHGGFELVVADRGPGLAPEVRERLFRPFTTTRRDGVGLGLALAHRIVTLHGGTLRVEDRPAGGTVARMAFPAGALVAQHFVTQSSDVEQGRRSSG